MSPSHWIFSAILAGGLRYHPSECHNYQQKLLVGCCLFQLKVFEEYRQSFCPNNPTPPPDSLFLYVQGNPGAGKTFCQRTMINCIRSIKGSRGYETAVAPTGCAASLLNGGTTYRTFRLPVGKKARQAPSNEGLPNGVDEAKAMVMQLVKLFSIIKDEDSMDTRESWAWFRQRLEETRSPVCAVIEPLPDANLPQEASITEADILLAQLMKESHIDFLHQRPFGGVPLITSSGDVHQLPPVAAKAHFDTSNAHRDNPACNIGRIAFKDFLDPPSDSGCRGVTFVLEASLRQNPGPFLDGLNKMRTGGMDYSSVDFFMSRQIGKLSRGERDLFEAQALYIVPTWKRAKPILVRYLKRLNKPIAKMIGKFNHKGRRNHAKEEVNLPALNAICEGSIVMLLVNYVVEQGLKNGSMGTVVDIVYADSTGPANRDSLPLYVVVDFPECTISAEEAWDPDHPTWVPIPVYEGRCEKKCCSMKIIPLRVCKAITIYKSQGITVGEGCVWRYVVIGMPGLGDKTNPGEELVAFSRAKKAEDFAILDDVEVTFETFLNIGRSEACQRKRAFEERLLNRQAASQEWIRNAIIDLDPSTDNKTFDGGFGALVAWYDSARRA